MAVVRGCMACSSTTWVAEVAVPAAALRMGVCWEPPGRTMGFSGEKALLMVLKGLIA
jgi:hypothetical protein